MDTMAMLHDVRRMGVVASGNGEADAAGPQTDGSVVAVPRQAHPVAPDTPRPDTWERPQAEDRHGYMETT